MVDDYCSCLIKRVKSDHSSELVTKLEKIRRASILDNKHTLIFKTGQNASWPFQSGFLNVFSDIAVGPPIRWFLSFAYTFIIKKYICFVWNRMEHRLYIKKLWRLISTTLLWKFVFMKRLMVKYVQCWYKVRIGTSSYESYTFLYKSDNPIGGLHCDVFKTALNWSRGIFCRPVWNLMCVCYPTLACSVGWKNGRC